MDAIYWRPPSAAEIASWRRPEDYPEPEVEVFDENWPALMLFIDNMTQWRCGPAGPVGLDYTVIQAAMDRQGLQGDDFDQRMEQIRVIERQALTCIHK